MKQAFEIDTQRFFAMANQNSLGSSWVNRLFQKRMYAKDVRETMRKMNEEEYDQPFPTAMLNALDISTSVSQDDLAQIPAIGGCIVTANHPFGAVEGIVLLETLIRIRNDVKILANSFLSIFPELRPYCIFVNPFQNRDANRQNIGALKEATAWVKNGGMLAAFPAGEVSHLSLRKCCVTDSKWSSAMAMIARRCRVPVVPVFFHGRNSISFQISGMASPLFRTALLPNELFNKSGATLHYRIGTPIPVRKVMDMESKEALTALMRTKTYALSAREICKKENCNPVQKATPIVAPIPPSIIKDEIAELPDVQRLVSHRHMSVYVAYARQIPNTMQELGRLREITFRAAGEGTGNETDLDQFDEYYQHLILFDEEKNRIAGAYRIGATDLIVPRHGFEGLYTNTLFAFSKKMKDLLLPALELGRSFIVEEYQRKPLSLALLWKGIGQYVCANPRYKILFGPVSISAEYKELSRQLMMAYFKRICATPRFNRQIRARNKVRQPLITRWDMDSVLRGLHSEADLSALISEIEDDKKGVPILLRQYLNLNGKIMQFNRDKHFSDVVDGLIVVNLENANPDVLARYMGKVQSIRFLQFHRLSSYRDAS